MLDALLLILIDSLILATKSLAPSASNPHFIILFVILRLSFVVDVTDWSTLDVLDVELIFVLVELSVLELFEVFCVLTVLDWTLELDDIFCELSTLL